MGDPIAPYRRSPMTDVIRHGRPPWQPIPCNQPSPRTPISDVSRLNKRAPSKAGAISRWKSGLGISARGRSSSIGFSAQVIAPEDRGTGEIFREVAPEDLLKYGLIPEFVGRLPVLATLRGSRRAGPQAHPQGAEERAGEAVSAAVRDGGHRSYASGGSARRNRSQGDRPQDRRAGAAVENIEHNEILLSRPKSD